MENAVIFLWGFLGSVIVDIAAMEQERRLCGTIPERYSDWRYVLVRLLLALAAGAIAVVQEAHKPLAALQIGASAPLIIRGLARGIMSTCRKGGKGIVPSRSTRSPANARKVHTEKRQKGWRRRTKRGTPRWRGPTAVERTLGQKTAKPKRDRAQ
jgi:hypothetical protein